MNKNQGLCLILHQFLNDDDPQSPEIIIYLMNIINKRALKRKLRRRIVLNKREVHYQPTLYSEHWVNEYSEYDFFIHFRMQRQTFDNLMNLILRNGNILKVYRGGFHPVEVEKIQQMSIFYLAHQIPLCQIGDRFNVATSTVLSCVQLWIANLVQLAPELIKWPSEAERVHVEERFRNLAGFPGVIGAVDGCHVNIMAPADQQRCYQNRYTTHSINFQGICTADGMFTNVFVGFPGSANDCRVMANSELYKKIEDHGKDVFFRPNQHLLGDKIYPLKEWLIPPYKDYGRITAAQKKFNKVHSKTRVKIENCFGMLKGRWRRLKYIQVYKVERASGIIMACCLLHNFCLINNDQADALAVNEIEIRRLNVDQNVRVQDQNRAAAVRKRDDIMRMLQ